MIFPLGGLQCLVLGCHTRALPRYLRNVTGLQHGLLAYGSPWDMKSHVILCKPMGYDTKLGPSVSHESRAILAAMAGFLIGYTLSLGIRSLPSPSIFSTRCCSRTKSVISSIPRIQSLENLVTI